MAVCDSSQPESKRVLPQLQPLQLRKEGGEGGVLHPWLPQQPRGVQAERQPACQYCWHFQHVPAGL